MWPLVSMAAGDDRVLAGFDAAQVDVKEDPAILGARFGVERGGLPVAVVELGPRLL